MYIGCPEYSLHLFAAVARKPNFCVVRCVRIACALPKVHGISKQRRIISQTNATRALFRISRVSLRIPRIRVFVRGTKHIKERCFAAALDVDQERRNLGSRVMTETEGLITESSDVDSTQWSDTSRQAVSTAKGTRANVVSPPL